LIILGDMVQREGAGNCVKSGVSEWELLCVRDLKARRNAALTCSALSALDHLDGGVDAVDRAAGCYPFGEHHCETAGTASDVEHSRAGLQLEIISKHDPEAFSASAE
jgi:hypothetical protein